MCGSLPLTKSVELPSDIEREIFEVTARNFPGTAVKLAGLSKTVQHWMEWIIYETVVLDLPSSRTAALLRTIEAKPAGFFSRRVKRLYLSYSVTPAEAERILSVCTGLTQLTCWIQHQHDGWLLRYLNSTPLSHLTRLSIKLDMVTERNSIPSFSDELYQNLTHLDIVLPPPLNSGTLIDWEALIALPHLKHLIIGDLFPSEHMYLIPVLRQLLHSGPALEVLAIITNEPAMRGALESENFDDPRMLIIPRFNWPFDLPTYWKKLYRSELDGWEPTADKAKAQHLEWNTKRCHSFSQTNSLSP
ncbi:hypothetical protein BDP27DRAFT_1431698 [Rhodocollybia butyracea]|uniref:Uncharacterized protein n=1 Tax=Rhodocollybia butyracea TaxID=206335 RepID=A0A9P5P991_9AGAR|nr:hypothetical protein BDP27DRAFT_1431698 [Rhodocollybia butyracea]